MGINTTFSAKRLNVNTSWKRFYTERDVTIARQGTFDRDTRFFTIGSCFANELRHALEQRDFATLPPINPSIHHLFPDDFKSKSSWGSWDERVQLQFYNTFSIRQEFDKAFDVWQQADDDFFKVERSDATKYWDPYRRALYTTSPEDFATLKRELDQGLRDAIHTADACVITLGMTEAFFRKDNGLATCQYNRFFQDRVEFRATDYEENFANIDKICEMYFAAYPDRRIVLTVSPVALAQTFRDMDVVVANMDSKSTLRTVAAAIDRKWPNVIYWPSYEIVMWNENSWQPDLRHVHPERVASIMDAFVECHIAGVDSNESSETWDKRDQFIAGQVETRRKAILEKEAALAAEKERLLAEKLAKREEALKAKEAKIQAELARRADVLRQKTNKQSV